MTNQSFFFKLKDYLIKEMEEEDLLKLRIGFLEIFRLSFQRDKLSSLKQFESTQWKCKIIISSFCFEKKV